MRKEIAIFMIIITSVSCSRLENAEVSSQLPPIWPDYASVTVPVNIAPLNFGAADDIDCSRMYVKVKNEDEETVLSSRGRSASFGLGRWHRVLASQAGRKLYFEVSMKIGGRWIKYSPFEIKVSRDSIDYGLTYRMIPPGYQSFGRMGIYERNLSNFRQRTLIDSRMIESGCVNCHTANKGNPEQFSIHFRGKHSATLIHDDGRDDMLDTVTDTTGGSFVYPYWHPSGKYVAYSVNTTRQSFFSASDKWIEVYDEKSDVVVYKPQSHEILIPSLAMRKDRFETTPAFSPDGSTLYFCVSDTGTLPTDIAKMKYSLCALSFDPAAGTFGDKIDTLISAEDENRSFAFPRPSYDGKYILVTEAECGYFLIHHKEADLWIYNVETGEYGPAGDINSEWSESFHNWSTNSRWAVVCSRRDDGMYTRLYLAHFDDSTGRFEKAFLLPQKNPRRYYDELIYSYNTPDFTVAPVHLKAERVRKGLLRKNRVKVTLGGSTG